MDTIDADDALEKHVAAHVTHTNGTFTLEDYQAARVTGLFR